MKAKHQFANIDQVLRYYLPTNAKDANYGEKQSALTYKEAYDLTREQPVNKLIKEAARKITKKQNERVSWSVTDLQLWIADSATLYNHKFLSIIMKSSFKCSFLQDIR